MFFINKISRKLMRNRYNINRYEILESISREEAMRRIKSKKRVYFLGSFFNYLIIIIAIIILLLWFRPFDALAEIIRII